MFHSILSEYLAHQILETTFEASEHHDGIFTCTVGAKPSNARYYLRDNDEVADLLATLASTKNRTGAPRSYTFNVMYENFARLLD